MKRMRRLWRLGLLLPLALLYWSAGADADQGVAFRLWRLRLPGTELGLCIEDMDDDGDQDLVVAHMTAPTGRARQISVFLHATKQQRFASEPERRYDVPLDACAFSAGDYDPAPGAEIAYLCPTRVVLQVGHEQRLLVELNGFFDYPEPGALPRWDLSLDLDGDRRPELIVPTKDGYTILRRGEEGLAVSGTIEVAATHRFGPGFETKLLNRFLSASSRLRRVLPADLDGDGRLDLAVYRSGGLAVFRQREDGTFPSEPDRERELELIEDADEGKEGTEAFKNVRLDLADLDGDGKAELIATRTVGELGVFSSMRTQQLVFRGTADGWNEKQPVTVLNLKGISGDPSFLDFDGDGRDDLIVSSFRMDLFTNLKRAIVESMTISYLVYLQGDEPGELFVEEPAFELDVEVPLSALERKQGARALILSADLNGDGINDMISRRADGGLETRLGRWEEGGLLGGRQLAFSDEPRNLQLARCLPPHAVDLDGDGADELVFEPFGGDEDTHRTLRVLGGDR